MREQVVFTGTFYIFCASSAGDKHIVLDSVKVVFCRFHWVRISPILGSSEVLITWTPNPDVEPGVYRIRHFGSYKYIFGGVNPYQGSTQPFKVREQLK